ncbi:hypothetical protein [Nocardia sp. NPDC005825]|uniref:hypothetical protein n=1 Tax=unclassified Nocardia TaxID=2637762 RepID=UPI0033C7D793
MYVAIRNIAGYQKWSLHESGDWRFQWVSEARAVEFGGTANRIIDRWEQPAEVGASGMTKGLSIWVRHCDVVSMDNDDDPKHAQVQWLPTPPPGSAVGIHIVVARPDQGIVDLSNSVPFDGFTLADGRVVLILMQYRELTDEVNAVVRDAQREAVARANVDWGAAVAPRMVISGFDDQGIRLVWDTAVIVNRESLS